MYSPFKRVGVSGSQTKISPARHSRIWFAKYDICTPCLVGLTLISALLFIIICLYVKVSETLCRPKV